MSKNLFNNLLIQAKAKSLMANKELHDKEILNKEQSIVRQPDPYDPSISIIYSSKVFVIFQNRFSSV